MRRLLFPGLAALTMLAILIGLGTWQVERLHWKRGLLAEITRAELDAPVPLGSEPTPWSKVIVSGELRNDLAALYGAEVRNTRNGPTMGSHLVVPLIRPNAPPLLINRGWVPSRRSEPLNEPTGPVTIEGYVHPPDKRGWFSARDDVPGRQFFTLDPPVIGRALGLPLVAPFSLTALGGPPPETWPDPARHLPQPPNNHLSYAITWFGLAAALIVVFLLWVRKTVR